MVGVVAINGDTSCPSSTGKQCDLVVGSSLMLDTKIGGWCLVSISTSSSSCIPWTSAMFQGFVKIGAPSGSVMAVSGEGKSLSRGSAAVTTSCFGGWAILNATKSWKSDPVEEVHQIFLSTNGNCLVEVIHFREACMILWKQKFFAHFSR